VDKPPVRPPSRFTDIWRVPRDLWRAERALDAGELARARALVGPLLERYPQLTFVRKVAAEVLYASGDPLSAAELFEAVLARRPKDRASVIGLVASSAALDRSGDARAAAARLPDDVDVRLALAWSELVALGGDRAAGARVVAELGHDPELGRSREREAMHAALRAIVAARQRDASGARAAAEEARRRGGGVRATDRAFVAYLRAIAYRELEAREEAARAFAEAVDAAPDSIGAALARRERVRP
jgi:tetratricopeptide (TPR) repeat protein